MNHKTCYKLSNYDMFFLDKDFVETILLKNETRETFTKSGAISVDLCLKSGFTRIVSILQFTLHKTLQKQ